MAWTKLNNISHRNHPLFRVQLRNNETYKYLTISVKRPPLYGQVALQIRFIERCQRGLMPFVGRKSFQKLALKLSSLHVNVWTIQVFLGGPRGSVWAQRGVLSAHQVRTKLEKKKKKKKEEVTLRVNFTTYSKIKLVCSVKFPCLKVKDLTQESTSSKIREMHLENETRNVRDSTR